MGHIVLCRERDTGRVELDKTGKGIFSYVPSAFDRGHIMQGVRALARLLYQMGAEEIMTNTAGAPVWKREGEQSEVFQTLHDEMRGGLKKRERYVSAIEADAAFEKWLDTVTALGNDLSRSSFGSAHQMGTCRMSSSPAHGVVSPRGAVWGKEGLYVSDASLFPSASGVNPMVTTMAFGEWVGRRVGEDMAVAATGALVDDVRAKL